MQSVICVTNDNRLYNACLAKKKPALWAGEWMQCIIGIINDNRLYDSDEFDVEDEHAGGCAGLTAVC